MISLPSSSQWPKISSCQFLKSSCSLSDFPKVKLPEFAFLGRSNVGKSSLINFLCQNSSLAKVSSKPGSTNLVNHYLINQSFYFIDFPGYGFAKRSRSSRDSWGDTIERFLLTSENLRLLFLVLDISIPPQAVDLNFLSWLKLKQVPTAIVLTKLDKLKKAQQQKQIELFAQALSQVTESEQKVFQVSVVQKLGREILLQEIFGMLA
jgi:ribosome biogenesis GTP-binding protein YsxC/EngB